MGSLKPGRLRFNIYNSAAAKLVRLMVFEFVQDGGAPQRTVETFHAEGQQEISLEAGPQDAGVEQGGEHRAIQCQLVE